MYDNDYNMIPFCGIIYIEIKSFFENISCRLKLNCNEPDEIKAFHEITMC